MELIRGLHNLKPRHRGCVATLGNFDGVHLGHQAVIGQLADKAQALNLPTLVMLFEPQPQEFFDPAGAPPRLMRLREKVQALRRYSVDRVLCVNFDARFAALEPEVFIQRVLIEGLGCAISSSAMISVSVTGGAGFCHASGRRTRTWLSGWSISTASPLTANVCRARAFGRRWRRPIWRWPRNCSAARCGCADAWRTATSSGARSACPRPISICTGATRRSRALRRRAVRVAGRTAGRCGQHRHAPDGQLQGWRR